MKRNLRLLSAALLIALAPVAQAQTAGEVDTQVSTLDTTTANRGQTQVATRIAASFTSLTGGSQDESLALVNALRNGTSVTLTDPSASTTTGTGTTSTGTGTTSTGTTTTSTTTTSTTIAPATGKMGWGEVFISLALAKAELANLGITNPTADQLNAALNGGSITQADGTVVPVKGVLEMRADGMGWGQIAQAEGTKLGPVVSSIKSQRVKLASLPTTTTSTTSPTGTAATKSASAKGIVTATGSTPTQHGKSSKGIVTATGSSAGSTGSAHSSKGITTASGIAAGASSHGIVTAEGSIGSVGSGHASGRGVVTAAGGGAGGLSTAGMHSSHAGSGVVTAAGSSASGITTAQGSGNGNNGGTHGKGKGGG